MLSMSNRFGSSQSSIPSKSLGLGSTANPNNDYVVPQSSDDTISALRFSPTSDYLIASSWDNTVRCWEVNMATSQVLPRAMQSAQKPLLDACWHADGSKVFIAGADNTARMWDLGSNQVQQVAQHEQPVKYCTWVQANNYNCLMTGSWDKTLKFWDLRSPTPMGSLSLSDRVYCGDTIYPYCVIGTAQRGLIVINLENQPSELKTIESLLKYQHRCLAMFRDINNKPAGFAVGSIEGRVFIQYFEFKNAKDNFTFKCHRSEVTANSQDIYAVNGIAFHNQPGTQGSLVTIGSDGRYIFWEKDCRTKLKQSEQCNLPLTACTFNRTGSILAYSTGYDWSRGHEFFNPQEMKPAIYLRGCVEDVRKKK